MRAGDADLFIMSTTITVLTYNVHSCIGTDGKASPERIAEVIAQQNVDIAALQELDVRLLRTGLADQARIIARLLNMKYHFHPSFRMEEGQYGNTILSKLPMRLVQAEEIPTIPGRRILEKRGALWVAVSLPGRELNIITTHLGLNRQERLAQTEALLGSKWLGSDACRTPLILCGDLNTQPWSSVYRRFSAALCDAHGSSPGPKLTWPSRVPLIRLDYLFHSPDIAIREIRVHRTALTRQASDHLPVVATCAIADVREGVAGALDAERK